MSTPAFKPKDVVAVPKKNGRGWWYKEILEVREDGRFVKVAGGRGAGYAWWVVASACRTIAEHQRLQRKWREEHRSK